jgi:urease beta subunit
MKPGEYLLNEGEIEANSGRKTATVLVKNTGDRPIQIENTAPHVCRPVRTNDRR